MTKCICLAVLAGAAAWGAAPGPARAGETPGAEAVDRAFAQLRTYEDDQPREVLAFLERHVARSTGEAARRRAVADRLFALLADPSTTDAARRFIFTQLALVAEAADVPRLAPLLADAKTADPARRVLERVPGEAAVAALRVALGRAEGTDKVGLINSLGVRRDEPAVPLLIPLLADRDGQVAAAVARALGAIGTAPAADALLQAEARAEAGLQPVIRDALLRSAERLAAGKDSKAAEAVYRRLLAGGPAAPVRLAALAGLAKVSGDAAMPLLLEAVASGDAVLRAGAVRLARDLAGAGVTAALVQQLDALDPPGQALVLGALAERGDRSAAGAVAKRIESQDDAVRSAAVAALAALGDAGSVERLARLAAADTGAVQQAARTGLDRLMGADVDKKVLAGAAAGDPAVRAELLRAAAARRADGAAGVLLGAAADAQEGVRLAALEGLAVLAPPEAYPRLVERLVAAAGSAEAVAAERAVLAAGGRLAGPAERAGPLAAALKDAPGPARARLLRVLAAGGGAEALEAVRACLKAEDAAVRDAAVRALAAWPDDAAAGDLLALAREADHPTHRVLAIRGYLRLASAEKEARARLRMLREIRPAAATAEARRTLLAALADVADAAALEVARSFLEDKEVAAEAALTVRRIEEALKAKPPAGGAAAMPAPDPRRSAARREELAKRAPAGFRLACYLDCGPEAQDGAAGGPSLRQASGQGHFWPGSGAAAAVRFGTVAFDGREVVFEAAGLDPRRQYQAGFSWWDYDHDTRAASVWAAGKAGSPVRLLEKTKLPAGQARSEKPAEKTVALPRELTVGGTVRLLFRNEGGPNAVVSEVWLWESEAEGPPPPPGAGAAGAGPAGAAPVGAVPAAAVQASGKAGAAARVLIVTGIEYPGHKWRETAPALRQMLEADPRLAVDVVESPEFLASPRLTDYAVLVFNWMNWEAPAPGEAARENLRRFVEGGGGLVLVHFACGAFQDWPEFRRLAGRAWDPKLRGHDPHGRFRVEITSAKHPITAGLTAFETVDELYTCLAGDAPVEVLATARSKVDGKDYSMAFVLEYGKGRVFHSVLGHDVRALAPPAVAELYRRGTAWAAGLAPVAPAAGG